MLMSNDGNRSRNALVPEFPLLIDEKVAPGSNKRMSNTPSYLVAEKSQISHQHTKGVVLTDVLHARPVLEPVYKIIRVKELSEIIGLSRSTIYDRMNSQSKRFDPTFPRPIRLGLASVGWSLSEVMAWIAARPQANPITMYEE